MMGTAMGTVMLVEAAVTVLTVLNERRTAFFHIRRLLLDLVVVLQAFLLGCGVFRFGGRKGGAGQKGC